MKLKSYSEFADKFCWERNDRLNYRFIFCRVDGYTHCYLPCSYITDAVFSKAQHLPRKPHKGKQAFTPKELTDISIVDYLYENK